MLCQNCKINESTIHLYTNVNGRQQQVDLCQNCYKIMKTDPNNSFLKGMTQRSQLTGDPFEDFFNNLETSKVRKNLKPLQLNPEAVMEVAATAKTITVVVVKIPRQSTPSKAKKGLLEEFGINVTEIARKGILTLSSAVTRRLSVSSKFSTVEPRTTRF